MEIVNAGTLSAAARALKLLTSSHEQGLSALELRLGANDSEQNPFAGRTSYLLLIVVGPVALVVSVRPGMHRDFC